MLYEGEPRADLRKPDLASSSQLRYPKIKEKMQISRLEPSVQRQPQCLSRIVRLRGLQCGRYKGRTKGTGSQRKGLAPPGDDSWRHSIRPKGKVQHTVRLSIATLRSFCDNPWHAQYRTMQHSDAVLCLCFPTTTRLHPFTSH